MKKQISKPSIGSPRLRSLIYTIIGMSIVATLSGCNGGTNAQSPNEHLASIINANTPLETALKNQLLEISNGTNVINLSNSLFMTMGQKYDYVLKDKNLNLLESGVVDCRSYTDCLINTKTKIDPYIAYNLELSQKSELVGGAYFMGQVGTIADVVIDPNSTSLLLGQYASSWIKDAIKLVVVEQNLFNNAMNYKKGYSLANIRYLYFIYLTQTKNQSSAQALDTMKNIYQNCANNNSCSLDNEFVSDPKVIDAVEEKLKDIINKYLKDKKDSTMGDALEWYNNNIKSKMDKAFEINGVIGSFFPGAGGKYMNSIGSVKDGLFTVISSVFDVLGAQDSKAARERINTFNKNLETVYKAKAPDLQDLINQILEIMSSMANYNLQNDISLANIFMNNSYQTVNNNLVIDGNIVSMEDYLRINHDINHIDFSNKIYNWIATDQGSSNAAIFDGASQKERLSSITRMTNPATIKAVALMAKNAANNLERKDNVNSITTIRSYNAVMLRNLINTISSLQQSEYIDGIGLYLLEKSNYRSNFKGRINLVYSTIGSVSLSGDYDKDVETMAGVYKSKLDELINIYYGTIIPEKTFVPDIALQQLEVKSKCNITYSDGYNKIGAICPYFVKNDNNIIESKFNYSEIYKPSEKCLTTNEDGSGDLMSIANVKNFAGKIYCRTNGVEQWLADNKNKAYNALTLRLNEVSNGGPNAWYLLEENYYYYPDNNREVQEYMSPLQSRDGSWMSTTGLRLVFLSNPNGDFKFKPANEDESKLNPLFIPRRIPDGHNIEDFGVYDPYGNEIGEFKGYLNTGGLISSWKADEVKPETLLLASIYNNCDTSSGPVIKCKSPYGDYKLKAVPVMRTAPYHNSNDIKGPIHLSPTLIPHNTDYLFAGETPDGKFKILDVPKDGGWDKSCSSLEADQLSNGYWAVTKKCNDGYGGVRSSVFGNGKDPIRFCYNYYNGNNDGIIRCLFN